MVKVNKETALNWYHQMVLIRDFEEACYNLYQEKRITGVYLHLYSGHEAIGVGAIANMNIGSDHIIAAYRDHGIALALGVDVNRLMAEMMGRRDGVSGGKGGSMHLVSKEKRFYGGYAIVGGHIPLASGIALAAQYNDTDEVCVSMIGDGATNNGYFHEALNISGVWNLPNVWIIENNGYGMGTEVERASAITELHKRAESYGTKDFGRVNGQDVMAVNDIMQEAVAYARAGNGPALIEAITYRYYGHGVSDKQYDTRLKEELEQWRADKDPITLLRNNITDKYKNTEGELEKLEKQASETVEAAVAFAEDSPLPDTYEYLMSNIYVEEAQ